MNKYNILSFVFLLDALVTAGLLMRDPAERNNILVKHDDIPPDAWASINIFTLAEDLLYSEKQRETLFAAVKEKGKIPVFSNEGNFVGLRNVGG